MKAYIAGKLGTDSERKRLAEMAFLCKKLGISTFLPHRDIGLIKDFSEVDKIFKGDIIEGFRDVDILIADLNGLHVGAGTSWEMGYAYAKGIPVIGLKSDEPVEDALEYLSAILIGSTEIVKSIDELKEKLRSFA